MKDQISEEVKKERALKLREISDELGNDFVQSVLGKEYDVIVETCEDGVCTGVTPNYIPVQFSCSDESEGEDKNGVGDKGENLIGKILKVKLEKLKNRGLVQAVTC